MSYQVRGLTPQEMDAEETAEEITQLRKYKQNKDRVYVEATLNPEEGTFRVIVDDNVLERVVVG